MSLDLKNADTIRKDKAMALARGEGIKYGLFGLILGGGILIGTRNSNFFIKYMSVSAKTSIPVMMGLFGFTLQYELLLIDASKRPEKYGLSDEHIIAGKITRMPAHHRAMNMIYDHPFVLIFITGLPIVATILSSQMKHTHLTLSQKIMHSRVYAQGGILTVALSTMAFRDYMDKNGRFPEPTD